MYWYIYLDGVRLPEPYETIDQVNAAMDELKERLCAPMLSCSYE